VILRRDHVAGGVFVVAGLAAYALSGDLPFGTIAMPGAGMMPKLAIAFMILFGLILVARAGGSPPWAEIAWGDFPHAVRVIIATSLGIALYEPLGFFLTMTLMLFGLLLVVEKQGVIRAAAFSIGVSAFAYVLFGTLLKSTLPQGPLGF
jgi:Tripartite tricarboxylate transporter TctB family